MVDLNNRMSYVVGEVTHSYWPRRSVQFTLVLVPTPGVISPDPDTIEQYGVNHMIYFSAVHEPERTVCLALHGKSTAELKAWILDQWGKYKIDPATCETQLRPIFEYVTQVGLAP